MQHFDFPSSQDEEDDLLLLQEQFYASKNTSRPAAIPSSKSTHSTTSFQPTISNKPTQSKQTESSKQPALVASTILERDPDAPSFPTANSTSFGFPKPKHRTTFPNDKSLSRSFKSKMSNKPKTAGSTPATMLATAKPGIPANVTGLNRTTESEFDQEIHEENLSKVASMTPEELEESQREILQKLDPKIVEMLRNRAEKKYGTSNAVNDRRMKSEDKMRDITSLPIPSDLQIPNRDLEIEKMLWMSETNTSETIEIDESAPVEKIRFAFDGTLIKGEVEAKNELKGLYHHGDDPEKAGYTIGELCHLCRSTVPAQRILALSTLTNVIRMVRASKFETPMVPEKVALLLIELEYPFILRLALDDPNYSTVAPTLTALGCYLGYEDDDDYDYVLASHESLLDAEWYQSSKTSVVGLGIWMDPSSENQEERNSSTTPSVEKIKEIMQKDIISGLMHTSVHHRLQFILGSISFSGAIKRAAIRVLVRMARHSRTVALQIADCKDVISLLIAMICERCEHEESLPDPQPIKLLRILCMASQTVTQRIMSQQVLIDSLVSIISRFTAALTSDENSKTSETKRLSILHTIVHREIMSLFSVSFSYNIGYEFFHKNRDGLFLITQNLQLRVPIREDEFSDTDRHYVLFVASHFKFLALACRLYSRHNQKKVAKTDLDKVLKDSDDVLYRFVLCALIIEKRFNFILGLNKADLKDMYKVAAWDSVLGFIYSYVKAVRTSSTLAAGLVLPHSENHEMLIQAWKFSPGFKSITNQIENWIKHKGKLIGYAAQQQYGELVHPTYEYDNWMNSVFLDWISTQLLLLLSNADVQSNLEDIIYSILSNERLLSIVESINLLEIGNNSISRFMRAFFLCQNRVNGDKSLVAEYAFLALRFQSAGDECVVEEIWEWMFKSIPRMKPESLLLDDGRVLVIDDPVAQIYKPVLMDPVTLKLSKSLRVDAVTTPEMLMLERTKAVNVVDGLNSALWMLGPIRLMLKEIRSIIPNDDEDEEEEAEFMKIKQAAMTTAYICLNTFVQFQKISKDKFAAFQYKGGQRHELFYLLLFIVFLLPSINQKSSEPFRNDQINRLLNESLEILCSWSFENHKSVPKWNLDAVASELSFPGFLQLYSDLISHYYAVSYGDLTFAKYLLMPALFIDSLNVEHRLEFWNSVFEPGCLKLISDVNRTDFGNWIFVKEDNKDILSRLVKILIVEGIDSSAIWSFAKRTLKDCDTSVLMSICGSSKLLQSVQDKLKI
ncbi:RNA polymerase II associated protein 1 [Nowakowskiella sp. JEL0407]|nr:RNA polymerase II associated protein 1 [Nowakowskiella sp. JEL0407]